MAESRAAWGIDIGQSALKAIKLRYSETTGQVIAAAFDYIQYPKILSQPDAVPEEIIREAMNTFLSRNSLQGDLVGFSVPGHSSLVRFIQLPPVEVSKLAEIVKYEARQQIPFPLEEVIWDFQPVGSGIEESGYLLEAEVGLFAMKRDQVTNQLRPFVNAKVEVELIQIAPLGLFNTLCYDELSMRPGTPSGDSDHIILLDMGCDNTTLMVSNGKKIWVRNIPIGGNHFTRALTKEMKLSFAKAEHLKCNATKSPDPRAVFQALRPVFNDFVSEIQRSVGFFSSVNRAAKITKVIGFGNGFKLAGLQKFLQQNLQYDVERPDAFKALGGDSVINSPLFADNVLSFAVPYGVALQQLGQTNIQTTLLPPEIARERMIRSKKPWLVATAAALMLGLAGATIGNARAFTYVDNPDFTKAVEEADKYTKTVAGYEGAYGSEKTSFENDKKRVTDTVTGRRDISWMELVDTVNDCLPRDDADAGDLPIEKRNQVAIKSFSSEKVADMTAGYFDLLAPHLKDYMPKAEREAGPQGEGYVVSIVGTHWHNGDQPEQQEIQYLINYCLRNFQKWQIKRGDGPTRDVARMGITHATISDYKSKRVMYSPTGRVDTRPVRNVLTPGGAALPMPMNPGVPMGPGGPTDARPIQEGEFVIQFAFKPTLPAERKDAPVVEGVEPDPIPLMPEDVKLTHPELAAAAADAAKKQAAAAAAAASPEGSPMPMDGSAPAEPAPPM
jgi:type IV pilus assembly protein PilM